MQPQNVLWADLRFRRATAGHRSLIPDDWPVEKVETPDRITAMAIRLTPGVVIFEFDQPDLHSLNALSHMRQRVASVPVLMLTEYHSEALAVWALRNRVADYLVVPLIKQQLLDSLQAVLASQAAVASVQPSPPIPRELCFRRANPQNTAAAIRYVQAHYASEIREETVAALCHMGVSTFSRVFKAEHGKTFREYMLALRLTKASDLLHSSGMSVTDVAFSVGFNDVAHFSRTFKRLTGETPSSFQQDHVNQAKSGKNFLLSEKKTQNIWRQMP